MKHLLNLRNLQTVKKKLQKMIYLYYLQINKFKLMMYLFINLQMFKFNMQLRMFHLQPLQLLIQTEKQSLRQQQVQDQLKPFSIR